MLTLFVFIDLIQMCVLEPSLHRISTVVIRSKTEYKVMMQTHEEYFIGVYNDVPVESYHIYHDHLQFFDIDTIVENWF